jgi:GNAT superfamily N-acetyltransferase
VSGVAFRPYRTEDEPGLRALFQSVYGPEAGRRTSAWRYLAPAPWPPAMQVAEADGRIVGAQPGHAIDLLIDGVPVKGLLLLDVMTHPDYRRRGVFAGVVEGLRMRASGEGYRVLLTTPNRDAERGFARLAAWTRLGELEPWVAVGDAATLLMAGGRGADLLRLPATSWRRLISRGVEGPGVVPGGYPGDGFTERLWRSIAGVTAGCLIARDARFVSWRFGAGSGRAYSFLCAGTLEKPEALVVIGEGRLLGRAVLMLVDVMTTRATAGAAVGLLRTLAAQASRERRAAVVGWFARGSALGRVLREAGFHRVPAMLRPRPYAVWGCSDLPVAQRTRALDLGAWHMSLADSDLA